MFTADALQAWARELTVNVQALNAQAARELLVKTARDERDRVLREQTARSGGIAPLYRQVVDGIEDAALEQVRADGVIVFGWNYAPEITQDTIYALAGRSPVRSGQYVASFEIAVDDLYSAALSDITINTREIRIIATAPYSRRLEVGKDKDGNPFVKQVAPHIVEETMIVQRALLGSIAEFEFGYSDIPGAWELSPQGRIPRHFENGRWAYRPSPRSETHVRYPTIIMRPRVA